MPRKKVPEAVPPEELSAALPQGEVEQSGEATPVSEPEGIPADGEPAGSVSEAPYSPEPEEETALAIEPAADAIGGTPTTPPADSDEPPSEEADAPPQPDALAPGRGVAEQEEIVDSSNPPAESLDALLSETCAADEDDDLSLMEANDSPPAQQVPTFEQMESNEAAAPARARRTVRRRKAAEPEPAAQAAPLPRASAPTARPDTSSILSIDAKSEVETQEDLEDTIWHEIRNAYRTRRILTGTLGGVEQGQDGKSLVIVEYKGFRVVIPAREMMLVLERRPSGNAYADLMRRQNQILSAMMGAEIDFIVRGIDNKTRSIVASRKEAMLKKRQIFYLDTDQTGSYRIYEGRLVQARVTAVAEKAVRIEAFGVECPILARDLAWDWLGDARDRFSVGDRIVVRILSVQRNSLEDISIQADVKSVSSNTDLDNLKKCRVQGKYAGKITDIHKGMVFVRLTNGVNAIAHACLDRRLPGKKDDVSFVITHLDAERGVALGIITKIIRQNL